MYDLVAAPVRNGPPPRLTDFIAPENQEAVDRGKEAILRGDIDFDDNRYRIVRTDGEVRDVRAITQLIRTDDGTPRRIIGAVVDVTAQSRYESQLDAARREAESAAALKSAILANMSHEIRTPLTAVIGYAQLLSGELDGAHRDLTEPIETGGNRLLATLDSVLDFARIEAGELHLEAIRIDLAAEARSLLTRFRRQSEAKGLRLRIETPEAPVYALAPSGELGRVLTNLVSNAIKFTTSGAVTVQASAEREAAVIVVRDTGQGIDPAFVPHLFEPFQQESSGDARQHEGSGLGLAITQRLVQAMGGTIQVDSVPGEGTAVTIRLPRAVPPPSEPPAPAGIAWISRATGTTATDRARLDPAPVTS
jgi:signal transduction histidine kinase